MKKAVIIVSIVLVLSLILNVLLGVSYFAQKGKSGLPSFNALFTETSGSLDAGFSGSLYTVSNPNDTNAWTKDITEQYLNNQLQYGLIDDFVFIDTSYVSPINDGYYDFYVDIDVRPSQKAIREMPEVFLTTGKRANSSMTTSEQQQQYIATANQEWIKNIALHFTAQQDVNDSTKFNYSGVSFDSIKVYLYGSDKKLGN